MITSAKERLDLTSASNLFRARVKSYCILGMSDHILFIHDNKLSILFLYRFPRLFVNFNDVTFGGRKSESEITEFISQCELSELFYWEYSIKHCYIYNKTKLNEKERCLCCNKVTVVRNTSYRSVRLIYRHCTFIHETLTTKITINQSIYYPELNIYEIVGKDEVLISTMDCLSFTCFFSTNFTICWNVEVFMKAYRQSCSSPYQNNNLTCNSWNKILNCHLSYVILHWYKMTNVIQFEINVKRNAQYKYKSNTIYFDAE